MAHYTVAILWERVAQDFLGNRYSRKQTLRFNGRIGAAESSSPHIVPAPLSDPAAVDLKEAFVASFAGCHML